MIGIQATYLNILLIITILGSQNELRISDSPKGGRIRSGGFCFYA